MKMTFKDWVKSGSPFIWLNAGAVAISIVMVLGLIGFIGAKGLVHFVSNHIRHIGPAKTKHQHGKRHHNHHRKYAEQIIF